MQNTDSLRKLKGSLKILDEGGGMMAWGMVAGGGGLIDSEA